MIFGRDFTSQLAAATEKLAINRIRDFRLRIQSLEEQNEGKQLTHINQNRDEASIVCFFFN